MAASGKNRIRHPLPETTWPTREQARIALWFQPIRLGPVIARTRTWVPAMVPWRATEDGFVTRDVLDWYARFADGQPGVLVVEATGIRDIPSGPLLRIGHVSTRYRGAPSSSRTGLPSSSKIGVRDAPRVEDATDSR